MHASRSCSCSASRRWRSDAPPRASAGRAVQAVVQALQRERVAVVQLPGAQLRRTLDRTQPEEQLVLDRFDLGRIARVEGAGAPQPARVPALAQAAEQMLG